MAEFKPGDRVKIQTEWFHEKESDYNSGEGVVVSKGCSPKCVCGDYYEVLHDKDASDDTSWAEAVAFGMTTPYSSKELTKID